jgi:cobalt-zinc-cadmium efflux system outer membrane protein
MKIIYFYLIFIFYLSAQESIELSLTTAFELSLKQNPFLVAERLNVRIAEGEIVRARTLPNPMLNSQELFRSKPEGSILAARNRQDWLQLTQTIPVAGQRAYSIERAKNNLTLTKNQIQEFERNLLFLVGNQWLDTKLIQERLEVISKTVLSMSELLKINALRLKNQAITKAEYMRTENLQEIYQAEYLNTETRFVNEIRNLKFLLAIEKNILLKENNLFIKNYALEKKEELIAYALKHRSDILSADTSVLVARSNVKVQEAFAYPTPEIGFIYNPQNGEQYLGTYATIPIPIFDRNQGAILSAKAELEKANKQREALYRQVEVEVLNSLMNLNTAKLNYQRYEKIFQSSEKIVEIVRYSYLKGGTTIIDFLDAQRNWFESQINLLDAKFNLYKAYLELDYTTGKILESVP